MYFKKYAFYFFIIILTMIMTGCDKTIDMNGTYTLLIEGYNGYGTSSIEKDKSIVNDYFLKEGKDVFTKPQQRKHPCFSVW